MKAKGIKIYLNPNHEEDRRVMDYLLYSGVSNTKAITKAVIFYLDTLEGRCDNSQLLEQIRGAVRESLKDLQLNSQAVDFPSQVVQQDTEEPVSVLDFIEELQKQQNGVTSGEM